MVEHPDGIWEGRTSIRRKKRSNFSLHLFYSFWFNFEEQKIYLLKCFFQNLLNRHNTVFQCRKITSCWFFFSMCLTKSLWTVLQNMANIQTYKHISQKQNTCRSSQVFREITISKVRRNRSFLSDVLGCGYLTGTCFRNVPAFHILWISGRCITRDS